jgi:hypothetical protein
LDERDFHGPLAPAAKRATVAAGGAGVNSASTASEFEIPRRGIADICQRHPQHRDGAHPCSLIEEPDFPRRLENILSAIAEDLRPVLKARSVPRGKATPPSTWGVYDFPFGNETCAFSARLFSP